MLMRTTSLDVDSPNRFLQLLSYEDRALLGSSLERVEVVPGILLLCTGRPIDFLYFPEGPLVSIQTDSGTHRGIETALIGREGLIGWSGLSGCSPSAQTAVAQMRTGSVLRLPIETMRIACRASATLLPAVMRFVEIVIGQMAQAIASLRDTIERRVCRWLLMRHDRLPGDHLLTKHDDIGAGLGVRRASVTDCLHILEGEHLIRCRRGRIIVCDRTGLEALAGDSYGAPESCYRELIGPFGQDTRRGAGVGAGASAIPLFA